MDGTYNAVDGGEQWEKNKKWPHHQQA
jgi:hypothetical protein